MYIAPAMDHDIDPPEHHEREYMTEDEDRERHIVCTSQIAKYRKLAEAETDPAKKEEYLKAVVSWEERRARVRTMPPNWWAMPRRKELEAVDTGRRPEGEAT